MLTSMVVQIYAEKHLGKLSYLSNSENPGWKGTSPTPRIKNLTADITFIDEKTTVLSPDWELSWFE